MYHLKERITGMKKKLSIMLALLVVIALIPITAQAAALKTPVFSLVNKTDTTVQVSITKVTGASGYGIYKQVDGKWKRIDTTTKTKYTVKNLDPKTKYTFTVKAYKTVDGKKKFSTNYNKTGKSVTTWAAGRIAYPKDGTYLREDGEYAMDITNNNNVDMTYEIHEPNMSGKLSFGDVRMKRGEAWGSYPSYTFYFYKDGIKVVAPETSGLSGFYRLQQ